MNFDVFKKGEIFKSFELGYMSCLDWIYFDNIYLMVWYSDEVDDGLCKEDWGIVGLVVWFFDNCWMLFLWVGFL